LRSCLAPAAPARRKTRRDQIRAHPPRLGA
jgi:hypothetical protein